MKKACLFIVFVAVSICMLFADSSWYVSREVDDFGDPTGRFSVRIDGLSGTYKNSLTSSGNLKYNVEVNQYGRISFYLFEGGKAVNLTTTSSGPYMTNTDEKFKIQIKYDSGDVFTYDGTLKKDENYKYDIVANTFSDFRKALIEGKTIKVVISATNGSYNLGIIDVSDVSAELFYDKTLYVEGTELMAKGEYQQAIEKFNELKKENEKAFDIFNAADSLKRSQKELGRIKYEEAKTLIEKKEYQKAYDSIRVIETLCPDEFKQLGAKELKRDVGIATGVWDVGSIGPAGGIVFYDKGFYSDGWRYLEAAPYDLSIYNGKPTLSVSSRGANYIFSPATNAEKNEFTYVNGTDTYDERNCTIRDVGSGKNNTRLIITFLKEKKLPLDKSAAYLCDSLSFMYSGVVYDDWFLPSIDELDLLISTLYYVLQAEGRFSGNEVYYWSSSEDESDERNAFALKILHNWDVSRYYYYAGKSSTSLNWTSIGILPIRSF